ncbi:MAG TPA: hypothetical protein VM493_01055 [Vicinamibacterales bacterium]|jgi:hypothetical protein|nr:hypothetical protein [Vicinamibacterales bacterium]
MEEAFDYELDTAPFDVIVGEDIFAFIYTTAPQAIRSRVVKALEHLTKAEALRGVDDEMGAIRLIAGEEELVVAIFEWLKLQSDHFPEHADFVKQFKKHPVKQSFYPVLMQFRWVLADLLGADFIVDGLDEATSWTAMPVLEERGVRLSIRDEQGNELIRHDPLSIAISRPDLKDDEVADALFDTFAERVSQQGMTVPDFVRQRADFRNQILYASDEGTVSMKDTLGELLSVFQETYRDLLWTLAVLVGGKPPSKEWGVVVQFFRVYRRVLVESGLIKAA